MKEKFIKSTIILLLGGLITKILGMFNKIMLSRLIGTEGLSLYMLILPTFSLLISLSSFSVPLALSKLISEDNRNNKRLFISTVPILFIINIILIVIILLSADIISEKLLKNEGLTLSIKVMALVIPFTTLSSVCRSYFFGKEKMMPHVISNIVECLVRLLIIIYGISYFKNFGMKYILVFLILSNIVSESISTLILYLFLPRKIKLTKKDLTPSKIYIKDTLKISIPNTMSRLLGSITYFLEPIILIKVLSKDYSLSYITHEYGVISGYVLPLLLLPAFFSLAISQALLPIISKDYANRKLDAVKMKIIQTITIIIVLSILILIPMALYPGFFLKLLYKTTEGTSYLRILAPVMLLEYIQSPISFILEAINKSNVNFNASLISSLIRLSFLIILSYFHIGIYSFVYSLILNILITTLYQIINLKKYIK